MGSFQIPPGCREQRFEFLGRLRILNGIPGSPDMSEWIYRVHRDPGTCRATRPVVLAEELVLRLEYRRSNQGSLEFTPFMAPLEDRLRRVRKTFGSRGLAWKSRSHERRTPATPALGLPV